MLNHKIIQEFLTRWIFWRLLVLHFSTEGNICFTYLYYKYVQHKYSILNQKLSNINMLRKSFLSDFFCYFCDKLSSTQMLFRKVPWVRVFRIIFCHFFRYLLLWICLNSCEERCHDLSRSLKAPFSEEKSPWHPHLPLQVEQQ